MKQIKDVEILKQSIDGMFETYEGSEVVDALNSVLSIIDSLSVEVPEAKPGAIKELIDSYFSDYTGDGEFQNEFFENRVRSARAELASLQAGLDAAVSEIKRLVGLNNKYASNENELIAESSRAKDALRTLAKKYFIFINKNEKFFACSTCEYRDTCERIVSCVPKIIKDALEHQEEE